MPKKGHHGGELWKLLQSRVLGMSCLPQEEAKSLSHGAERTCFTLRASTGRLAAHWQGPCKGQYWGGKGEQG